MQGFLSPSCLRFSSLTLISLPVLIPGYASHTWLSEDGEVLTLDGREVGLRLREETPLVAHGPAAAKRLHCEASKFIDVLELFAFVRPARWCVPTARGLAQALGLAHPQTSEDQAIALLECTQLLINELAAQSGPDLEATLDLLWLAQSAGWPFANPCLQALGDQAMVRQSQRGVAALKVWRALQKWEDAAPPGRPGNAPLQTQEAEEALRAVLTDQAEDRPQQHTYSKGVVEAFAPAHEEGAPALVLAEAGTGVGKTLGYLAPARAWQQKNQGPVWLSTYTRNLQRQLDQELDKLYPNPAIKEERVVVRKGRENYLCLMNYEEQVQRVEQGGSRSLFGLILTARWIRASRAGELIGGDFPGWLRDMIGDSLFSELAVRRGECWHGACPHYGTCFAEKMARKTPHADMVVANHAFVMTQTLIDPGFGQETSPTHFVFDEGHHLFDAADSAYAGCLSGLETRDLRRWILGAERTNPTGFSGRARGLRKRLEDLSTSDKDLSDALHAVERAAQILPARGWYDRLRTRQPKGPVEAFLLHVADQVYTRTKAAEQQAGFSLEVEVRPLADGLSEAAKTLKADLQGLLRPLKSLAHLIQSRLEDQEEDISGEPDDALPSDQRRRLGGIANSIRQRALDPLSLYDLMLTDLSGETPKEAVDWFEVTRQDGKDLDVAYYRKFIDPTQPFMDLLAAQAQGALITSATLADQTGVAEVDWDAAETATGTRHAAVPPVRLSLASPYDYGRQARVFVVNDLERDKPGQSAAAMARLFLAAGGGSLGLFTSINRLKAAYAAMAPKLEAKNVRLLAQHIEAMDVTTLIDIFREEADTCLLGTDALRDGVDVPGQALRLLVFDRVPWPRPTLAHRARRAHFGPRIYDDRLTRLKLRQAFGRLIRKHDDRGAFVLLDSRLPSRLEGAFPGGVEVQRLSLKDTLANLKAFYAQSEL